MISILITHYKRPDSLINCMKAIRLLPWPMPIEIVVADDGSDIQVQETIKSLAIDKLILSEKNNGLASNLNKGLKACKGEFILYVQEDFIVNPRLLDVLDESIELLNNKKLDMIRYRANYKFKHLLPISPNINQIPKFSFRNFHLNTFQYSDHPFLTTPSFFERYGYFLENTSGGYGETEYAIRIVNSKAKIGISKKYYFHQAPDVPSVMDINPHKSKVKTKKGLIKITWRLARSLRQHLEWVLYRPKNRKLYTYSNKRKS